MITIPFGRVRIRETFSSNGIFLIKVDEQRALLGDFITYRYFAKEVAVQVQMN